MKFTTNTRRAVTTKCYTLPRGADRVRATWKGKARVFVYNHALTREENHRTAAVALATELGLEFGDPVMAAYAQDTKKKMTNSS